MDSDTKGEEFTSTISKTKRDIFVDFLRGLSVLGILFYHLVPGTPVGLGQGSMEFFFVISGFLITKTFTRRLSAGMGGLQGFAFSRLRRLLPTLCLYLIFVALVNFLKGKDIWLIAQSAFWSLAGFYNWFQICSAETIHGLGGIWSLSIEDQYYYLILILGSLLILSKSNKTNRLFFVFLIFYICLGAIGILMRIVNVEYHNNSLAWGSYNTFSRLWGFAIGGFVALGSSLVDVENIRRGHIKKLINIIFVSSFALAYISLLTVQKYNPEAFLQGWLWSPIFLGVCLFAATNFYNECPLLTDAFPRTAVPSSLSFKPFQTFRLVNWLFVFISKVGVACYPIYLFQESDRLVGLNVHWTFSVVWALAVGFLVHNLWERRFYAFPRYAFLSVRQVPAPKNS